MYSKARASKHKFFMQRILHFVTLQHVELLGGWIFTLKPPAGQSFSPLWLQVGFSEINFVTQIYTLMLDLKLSRGKEICVWWDKCSFF